ncbi:Protein of unknown function [Pyronema omphalodes CBS 100304]|uniref:Uncharacterized protein n=1 Tax=Pyronema omphalodes (strain CBS 100304) TaxID=1076935 RepID=U4LQX8_PYROM|nr:Protein of unknown function [Pyronema omphalodes CBS 100304]
MLGSALDISNDLPEDLDTSTQIHKKSEKVIIGEWLINKFGLNPRPSKEYLYCLSDVSHEFHWSPSGRYLLLGGHLYVNYDNVTQSKLNIRHVQMLSTDLIHGCAFNDKETRLAFLTYEKAGSQNLTLHIYDKLGPSLDSTWILRTVYALKSSPDRYPVTFHPFRSDLLLISTQPSDNERDDEELDPLCIYTVLPVYIKDNSTRLPITVIGRSRFTLKKYILINPLLNFRHAANISALIVSHGHASTLRLYQQTNTPPMIHLSFAQQPWFYTETVV